MILFHFTAKQFFPRVQKEGITKCVVPWSLRPDGKIRMSGGLQWLTRADDWGDQTWADAALLQPHAMRKTDYRIAVAIPEVARHNVVPWQLFARHHGLPVAEHFENFPDHVHWFIYIGAIPQNWFIESVRNPLRYETPGLIES